jgi:hypothetical protein
MPTSGKSKGSSNGVRQLYWKTCKTFDWKPMTTRNGLLPVSDSKQILYKTQLLFWRWFIKYQHSCHFDFTSLICTVILRFICVSWHKISIYYQHITTLPTLVVFR